MSDTYLINYLRTNYQDKNGKITESAVQQCEDALKSKGVQVNYNQLVGGLDRREFTKNPVLSGVYSDVTQSTTNNAINNDGTMGFNRLGPSERESHFTYGPTASSFGPFSSFHAFA
ncbi:MAG TPA: hypothetical protein V6C99_00130 [Oculatellaceae cyanobacterium]|jgi:hypothetical protein